MKIILTDEQYALACRVAAARQAAAVKKNRPSAHGYNEADSLKIHTQGALAELAVSITLRLKWNALLENINPHTPDVGDKFQVRSRSKYGWNLIVHPSDAEHHIFILAVVEDEKSRVVELVGYLNGVEAKLEKYWGDKFNTGRPAYWVPQSDLHPFEDLLPPKNTVQVVKKYFGPTPITHKLTACGSPHCNGCYDVGDGRKIHPPKPDAKYLSRGGGAEPRPMLKIKRKKNEKIKVLTTPYLKA